MFLNQFGSFCVVFLFMKKSKICSLSLFLFILSIWEWELILLFVLNRIIFLFNYAVLCSRLIFFYYSGSFNQTFFTFPYFFEDSFVCQGLGFRICRGLLVLSLFFSVTILNFNREFLLYVSLVSSKGNIFLFYYYYYVFCCCCCG